MVHDERMIAHTEHMNMRTKTCKIIFYNGQQNIRSQQIDKYKYLESRGESQFDSTLDQLSYITLLL